MNKKLNMHQCALLGGHGRPSSLHGFPRIWQHHVRRERQFVRQITNEKSPEKELRRKVKKHESSVANLWEINLLEVDPMLWSHKKVNRWFLGFGRPGGLNLDFRARKFGIPLNRFFSDGIFKTGFQIGVSPNQSVI